MATDKPLLILGGGLMGLAIGHELARQGRMVEILSRNRSEAAGFVAAGMLAPHAEGLTGELLKLGQLSLNCIPSWVEKIQEDSQMCCGLRHCGIIAPFIDANQRDTYPTAALGQGLNRKELEKEIPGIAPQWQTGLLFSQDGQIDNRRQLMRALEKACVGLGVHFQEGLEVLKILSNDEGFQGVKVRNAEGRIKNILCKEAVLCCGAWSSQLLEKIPIFPVKGQMMSIQGPRKALERVIFGPGIYLVPREDGLIVIGATNEKEAGFKKGLTPFGQKQLQEGLTRLLPEANQWPPMERWWGFRPCTPDKEPLIGASPLNGLWLATGHHRNGVLLAAKTSEIIAKCILKKEFNLEEKNLLKAFEWKRFEQN